MLGIHHRHEKWGALSLEHFQVAAGWRDSARDGWELYNG